MNDFGWFNLERLWRRLLNQALFLMECTLIGVALVFPMRMVLQADIWEYQANTDFLWTGIFLDLRYLLLLFIVLNLVVYAANLFWGRKTFGTPFVRIVSVVLAVLVQLLCAGSALFFIERGAFATFFDLTQSSGDQSFFRSYIGALFSSKFLWPFITGSLPLFCGGLLLFWVRQRKFKMALSPWLNTFSLFAGSVIFLNLYCWSPKIFPLLIDRERVSSPFTILESGSITQRNVFQWFQDLKTESNSIAKGMAHLGLKQWKEPLSDLLETPKGGDIAAMSNEIAAGLGDEKPIIWHILLEGFRSYDLYHSMSGAPKIVAPFLNGLYESSSLGHSHGVVGFKQVYQAGVRTTQGLSGTLCGLGTLPYALSITRDFGRTNLDCLPRIFNQLGFKTRFFNGVNPAFDKKNVFLNDQQTPFISGQEIRDKIDWPGWGVPDHLFYELIRNQFKPQEQAEYNVMVTISTHSPFVVPPTVESEVMDRYHKILKEHSKTLVDGEAERLLTFMYSDASLAKFVHSILASPEGRRTIFVIQADHTSFGNPVWGQRPEQTESIFAQIPLVIVYPRQDHETKSNFENYRKTLSEMVLSQNDIPRLILHSISELPVMKDAPLEKINHSLGGQTLAQATPIISGAKVWGYDIRSKFYYLDSKNRVVYYRPRPIPSPNFNVPPAAELPGDLEILAAVKSYFN